MKKKLFLFLFLNIILGMFYMIPVSALENHIVKITATIDGVKDPMNETFHYRLRSDGNNPDVPMGLPSEAEITLSGTPVNEKLSGTTTLDFSRTVFTKVGTYVFELIEDRSSNEQDYPRSQKVYKIYVDVRTVGGKMEIQALEQGLNTSKNQKEDIVFEHAPFLSYIVINTDLSGPNAFWNDRGVYFKYRVTIEGPPGRVYTILGQDTKVTFDGKSVTPDQTYTIRGDGSLYLDKNAPQLRRIMAGGDTNYVDIYMKESQTVTIGYDGKNGQIPVGTNYRIYKMEALKWDTHVDGKHATASSVKTVSINPRENATVFVHSRDIDIPITGLFIDHWPILLLLAITILGIVFIKRMKTE